MLNLFGVCVVNLATNLMAGMHFWPWNKKLQSKKLIGVSQLQYHKTFWKAIGMSKGKKLDLVQWGYIAQVCLWENFLFTDTSENDYFTKVLEVIK